MLSYKDYLTFAAAFIARPSTTGAIAPSSTSLCRTMVEWIDWDHVETVIEYGPGTGVCTAHIVSQIRPGSRFFAIEINPEFTHLLRRRFPQVHVYQDNILQVEKLCDLEGVRDVDTIISSLPWAVASAAEQDQYLDAMFAVLKPGGRFTTFAYIPGLLLPSGQRFQRQLARRFSTVRRSRMVWRNVPPAFVYHCRR